MARELTAQLLAFSEGMVATMTDMALVTAYTLGAYATVPRRQWGSVDLTVENQLEQFNYQTIKRAVLNLGQRRFVNKNLVTTDRYITRKGTDRLETLLPHYKTNRPWNGKLYLITYDLPNSRTSERNHLRRVFRQLGFGLLQKSTWVTAYDPQELLRQYVEADNLRKLIAVGTLETTVGIGATDVRETMSRVYPLEHLNQQYIQFASQAQFVAYQPLLLALRFWSILKEDPQLPFELLPDDWSGTQAYTLFRRYTGLV